ncbi:MAG: hypothetical protein IH582_10705 [Afipia sp.]|nr:hypothetical protein [Afipia sp.]
MTIDHHRVSVHAVDVIHEAVRFANGTTVALGLAEPRKRHAVVHELGDQFEIIRLCESREEAAEICDRLREEIERLAAEATRRLN